MADKKTRRGWFVKFRDAFRGMAVGMRGESSFLVHLPMAAAVVGLALILNVGSLRLTLLLLCITVVMAAELFNSAIERMAKAITSQQDTRIGDALDIASGAVLCASIGSAAVGLILLLPPLLSALFDA